MLLEIILVGILLLIPLAIFLTFLYSLYSLVHDLIKDIKQENFKTKAPKIYITWILYLCYVFYFHIPFIFIYKYFFDDNVYLNYYLIFGFLFSTLIPFPLHAFQYSFLFYNNRPDPSYLPLIIYPFYLFLFISLWIFPPIPFLILWIISKFYDLLFPIFIKNNRINHLESY